MAMGTQAPDNRSHAKRPWAHKLLPFSGSLTTFGFIVIAISVSYGAAADNLCYYLLGTGGSSSSADHSAGAAATAARLLACFVATLAGTNLIALGVYLNAGSEHPGHGAPQPLAAVSKKAAAAFARENTATLATLAASAAAAGLVAKTDGDPAVCFCLYALLVAATATITVALRGDK